MSKNKTTTRLIEIALRVDELVAGDYSIHDYTHDYDEEEDDDDDDDDNNDNKYSDAEIAYIICDHVLFNARLPGDFPFAVGDVMRHSRFTNVGLEFADKERHDAQLMFLHCKLEIIAAKQKIHMERMEEMMRNLGRVFENYRPPKKQKIKYDD